MTCARRAASLAVAGLRACVCVCACACLVPSSRAVAQARAGSLVVGIVHRNDAPLLRLDEDRGLTVAWTGAVGAWHRLVGRASLDLRVELFGVTVRGGGDRSESVRVHLGPEVGVVLDPTRGWAAGLSRGVRVAAGVDFSARLAGPGGEVVVPRLSIGWADVIPVGPGDFPFRPLRVEGALTWSPGTVLVTLAAGVEAEPLRRL